MKALALNSTLLQAAAVGSGGFIGALLRHGMSTLVNRYWHLPSIPLGTLAVNLLGCLLIGLLAALADTTQLFNQQTRLFLLVGLLGGFTTFSAFALESLQLLQDGSLLALSVYVSAHLLLGIGLTWLAYYWMTGGIH